MLNAHGDYSTFKNYDQKMEASFYYDGYDDVLNGNDTVTVAGMDFDAADVLFKLDPVAYRNGFLDYIDFLMREADPEELAELEDLFG